METLTIHSRMAHFRLIARITQISSKGIRAEANFDQAPVYAGLEAMAQLAALHVRQLIQFERHAFLLKIHHCRMPAVNVLAGRAGIEAGLRSQSSDAFIYDVVVRGLHGADFNSALLIGTRDYDDRFQKDILKAHYQALCEELKG